MTAAVAQRPPWYRRLFRRERAVAAGERPRHLGRGGKPRRSLLGIVVLLTLVLAVVGAVLGYALVPDIRARVNATVADLRLTLMPTIVRVIPSSSSGVGVDEHPASDAADDNIATYWLADPAQGTPLLTVQFPTAINAAGLVFHSGSATDSDFGLYRRPRTVEVRFPGSQAAPITFELEGAQSGAQVRNIDARGVTTIEIRIVDSFPPAQGGENRLALREVEFHQRR